MDQPRSPLPTPSPEPFSELVRFAYTHSAPEIKDELDFWKNLITDFEMFLAWDNPYDRIARDVRRRCLVHMAVECQLAAEAFGLIEPEYPNLAPVPAPPRHIPPKTTKPPTRLPGAAIPGGQVDADERTRPPQSSRPLTSPLIPEVSWHPDDVCRTCGEKYKDHLLECGHPVCDPRDRCASIDDAVDTVPATTPTVSAEGT